MLSKKANIVFAADASGSMTPGFQQLRKNLHRFAQPLFQANFDIRYVLPACNAGRTDAGQVFISES